MDLYLWPGFDEVKKYSTEVVEPFVNGHKCGLGKYAEQCGESIHAKFKPTWSRFARSEGHSEHREKLLSAVKQFGGRVFSPTISVLFLTFLGHKYISNTHC